MTMKDLSAYHYAAEALQNKIDQRGELYMQATSPAGAKFTGMPGGSGPKVSSTERYAECLAALDADIRQLRKDRDAKRHTLEQFLSTIPDAETQQIFRWRFVDCLNWVQIAEALNATDEYKNGARWARADAVRMRVKRYLAKTEAPA